MRSKDRIRGLGSHIYLSIYVVPLFHATATISRWSVMTALNYYLNSVCNLSSIKSSAFTLMYFIMKCCNSVMASQWRSCRNTGTDVARQSCFNHLEHGSNCQKSLVTLIGACGPYY